MWTYVMISGRFAQNMAMGTNAVGAVQWISDVSVVDLLNLCDMINCFFVCA